MSNFGRQDIGFRQTQTYKNLDSMQTITQNPTTGLTFTHQDTEFAITTPDGQSFGHIGYDLARHQWCYVPYGQPIKATGTLEQCQQAAQSDYTEQQSHEAVVTHIDTDVKPAYVHRRTSWRAAGSGYEQTVTVQQGSDIYRVLVASWFAQKLRVGSVVQLHQDRIDGLYLSWCPKPVRRQSAAA